MATTVVHCKKESYDAYIGRPSIWGNPFIVGKHGTLDEVLEKYKQHVLNTPLLRGELMSLNNKALGCWCHPKKCHGDVLVELINQVKKGELKL